MREFTPDQKQAIEERGKNILVSAAAGSGKTAVLVERIVRVITEDNVDIGRLLVVTFTEAAASEMRERILKALNKRLGEEPDNKHIQKQIMLMPKASISTIHSFCNSVLKKNYNAIGLDPSFRIGDGVEMDLMKEEVLDSIFDREHEHRDPVFYRLLSIYGGRLYDRDLRELVLKIYSFCEASLDMEAWLTESAGKFNLDSAQSLGESIWGRLIINQIKDLLESAINLAGEAVKYCKMPDGPYKYLDALTSDIESLNGLYELCSLGSLEAIQTRVRSVAFDKLASIRANDQVDEELKEIAKTIRDKKIKPVLKEIEERYFFKSFDLMSSDIADIYPIINKLCELVVEFKERYSEEKRAGNMLDFGDLEHYTYKILSENKDIAEDYKAQFCEIYTDEYQDSNILQEKILSLIASETGRFMVGDVKQSIYKFRRANPGIFIDKYKAYENSAQNLRIDLSTNFRSRENVLSCVNFIFRQIMSERTCSIEYGEAEMLRYGGLVGAGEEYDDTTELIIIETGSRTDIDDEEQDDEIKELSSVEKEAAVVAARIAELTSPDKPGRAEYGDITILLRSLSHAQIFVRALADAGIPAFANTSDGYFDNLEVLTMLSLLRIIDNPRQDISLLAVLYSPIYGLSADDLAKIRTTHPTGDFYSALKSYLYCDSSNLTVKKFWSDLGRWRKLRSQLPVSKLISTIFDESGYYDYISISTKAEKKKANLRTLFEHAVQFEKTSLQGLFRFISYIEKLIERDSHIKESAAGADGNNAVQIMTIHRSKGLEFPICFISNLGKKINRRDESASLILHQDNGMGPIHISPEPRIKSNTLPRAALASLIHEENYAEELRILYVALTRAKSKLILTGCVSSYENAFKSWAQTINYEQEKLPPHVVWDAASYLDFLGPCIVRHKDFEKLHGSLGRLSSCLFNDESRWRVSVVGSDTLARKVSRPTQAVNALCEDTEFDEACYLEYVRTIKESFGWEYGNIKETILPSKISISEIKRNYFSRMKSDSPQIMPELLKPTFNVPKFAAADKLSAAERGMAMHTLMEHIDIKETFTTEHVELLVRSLEARNLLSEQEARSIDIGKVAKFAGSQLASRMRTATELRKEIPFVLEIDAKDAYLQHVDEGALLVHGIIDCYFVENNCIVLVDYKSDRVGEEGVEGLKNRYKIQLDIYRKALENSLDMEVSECILYLFDIDECVNMFE